MPGQGRRPQRAGSVEAQHALSGLHAFRQAADTVDSDEAKRRHQLHLSCPFWSLTQHRHGVKPKFLGRFMHGTGPSNVMSDPLVTSQHSYVDLSNANVREKCRTVTMAAQELEVVSVDRPAIALSLPAGQPLLLGRGTLTGITSPGVSRQHCTLSADHSGHGARLVVLHRAGAAVVRARRNLSNSKDDVSPLILLSAGQSYEVSGTQSEDCVSHFDSAV